MGFRQSEIEIMAHVARYHRRSTPKKRHAAYRGLKPEIQARIKKLSGILRVADGLDRSHFQNVTDMKVQLTKEALILTIITQDEPHLEIWGAMRKRFLLSEMLNRSVIIDRN